MAYFFTSGLTAATQKELLMHTMQCLEENGLVIHCLALDGHATNLSMCRLLGASLHDANNFRPFFTLPDGKHPIYVLLDPCHVIKLVRNLLQAYGAIKTPEGIVKWSYVS